MAIKGLEDRVKIPRIGKIHLGKKNEEKGYPMPVDYFLVHSGVGTTQEAVDNFKAVYGDQPKKLDIMFMSDDIEVSFPMFYKKYGMKGLECKGTGESCTRPTTENTWETHECAGTNCPDYVQKKCKRIGNLIFMLPKVKGIGVWQIDTGSINTMLNIQTSFKMLKAMCGTLTNRMLKLSLNPFEKEISYKDKAGKQCKSNKTFYMLDIQYDQSLSDVISEREKKDATPALPENKVEVTKEDLETPIDLVNTDDTRTVMQALILDIENCKTIFELKKIFKIMEATDTKLITTEDYTNFETSYERKYKEINAKPESVFE